MLVSATVCPHPPALVPAVSQGASASLADLRQACVEAVRATVAVDHDILVCVGAGPGTARWGPGAGGSLDAFGVDVTFGGADPVLPPALTIAAYLLEQAGLPQPDAYQAVADSATGVEAAEIGEALASEADRVALLVMGDGSAKRSKRAPGYYDARAGAFDAEAVRALSRPDSEALLRIDPALAADLWVAGRPAWQVLAGAIGSGAGRLRGTVRYDAAPLGVGYFVVLLTTAGLSPLGLTEEAVAGDEDHPGERPFRSRRPVRAWEPEAAEAEASGRWSTVERSSGASWPPGPSPRP